MKRHKHAYLIRDLRELEKTIKNGLDEGARIAMANDAATAKDITDQQYKCIRGEIGGILEPAEKWSGT